MPIPGTTGCQLETRSRLACNTGHGAGSSSLRLRRGSVDLAPLRLHGSASRIDSPCSITSPGPSPVPRVGSLRLLALPSPAPTASSKSSLLLRSGTPASSSISALTSPQQLPDGSVHSYTSVVPSTPSVASFDTDQDATLAAASNEMIQHLRRLSRCLQRETSEQQHGEAQRLARQCARYQLHDLNRELMYLLRYARSVHRVRHHARLQAELKSTSPAQVHVRGVSLATCVMDDATLQHSDFSHADLENASLRRSNISKTSFFAANLRNAVFDGATLSEIDFTAADLTGASFRDCDAHALTHNVAVYGACLHNVIWPNAEVEDEMHHQASCQCMTIG